MLLRRLGGRCVRWLWRSSYRLCRGRGEDRLEGRCTRFWLGSRLWVGLVSGVVCPEVEGTY